MDDLLILACDHRTSLARHRLPTESASLAELKDVIYDGFAETWRADGARGQLGILIDAQTGEGVIHRARADGVQVALAVEASGQRELAWADGGPRALMRRVERVRPTFVKLLLRHHPREDGDLRARQAARASWLCAALRDTPSTVLLELLIPPRDEDRCDQVGAASRPRFLCESIAELRSVGVEPAIWKVEGVTSPEAAEEIAEAIGSDQRLLVLGRGENVDLVDQWIRVAAQTRKFAGFAVGRSLFVDALVAYSDGALSRAAAVSRIGHAYARRCSVWRDARRSR